MQEIILGIAWIFIGYLLGSIPFGYIFSRLTGKNPLEVGWKKTSGSNVFKNVGKWQGVATGLGDLGKGFVAVYFAQLLGFPVLVQVLAGTAAVAGHNWSIFLKFSGGRGIGTLIGALLPLSVQYFWIFFLSILSLAVLWSAAIGTILGLMVVLFLSIYFNEFSPAGLFILCCLPVVFIKRLSPIKEFKTINKKGYVAMSRLIFDDNQPLMKFRLKKILKKTPKPVANTLMATPKAGWQAAKFGAKIATKPVKALLKNSEKTVLELKPEDFKKMMISAAKKIVLHQEEINRINVFPVADKDTGYNLAATLLGVEGTVNKKEYTDFRELAKDMKDAAMTNARGNAGMIYTGYLIEFLDRIKHLETVDASHLSLALKKGIKASREAINEPVDGTILDVIRTVGEVSYEMAKTRKEKNIVKILEEAYRASQKTLLETKERLEVLKKNNVVDAGALGFVKILESWIESLKGIAPAYDNQITESLANEDMQSSENPKYEIVATFNRIAKEELEMLKEELNCFGDSLELIETETKIKFHVHTEDPDIVKERIAELPGIEIRTEEINIVAVKDKKPLGIVIDEIADLPQEFLAANDIEVVKFYSRFPNGARLESTSEIFQKMKEAAAAKKPLPITSAPTFKDFHKAYESAFNKFENILVITTSSKLSGSYSAARIARSMFKKPAKENIYVFDCATAESAEGLIGMKAQELISSGKSLEETVEFLKEFCLKVVLLGHIADFKYIVRGGRFKMPISLTSPLSFLQKIGFAFLLRLRIGKISLLGVRFGKEPMELLFKEINKEARGKSIKVAIAHADNLEEANKLKELLEKRPKTEVVFVSSVSAVIGTHIGPGTVLAAFYPTEVDNN